MKGYPSAGFPGNGGDASGGVRGKVVRVRVDCLLPADSPRLIGEDPNHVRLLAESDAALPPILVHRQTMRVIDGMHRLRAAVLKDQEMVDVRFFDGSSDEAFVAAVAANRAHGLPLTLADREAAAERIIRSQPYRSDRLVAVIAGLAAGTVGDIRRCLGQDGEHTHARVGRDGRVRPLDGAHGRRLASEVIASRPEASLREIAGAAGISLATARDVRERLRRGDDPLPPKLRQGQQPQQKPVELVRSGGERGGAQIAAGEDRAAMLQSLAKDPSLRFTESGRSLLRWLFTHARGPAGWENVVDAIPPHSTYVVAEVAQACAEEWSTFASKLHQRLLNTA